MDRFNNQTQSFCCTMSFKEECRLKSYIGKDEYYKQKSGPTPLRIEQIPIQVVKKRKRRKNAN